MRRNLLGEKSKVNVFSLADLAAISIHVPMGRSRSLYICVKSVPMSTELLNRITSNPRQCGGRPCIRGMRIRVKDVLDMLAGGASEEILADFPHLEPDDIRASLEYAAAQIDHAVVMVS